MSSVQEFRIESGYKPGSIGRIAELHGTYYHVHWGFGCVFRLIPATNSGVYQRFGFNFLTIPATLEPNSTHTFFRSSSGEPMDNGP